MKSYNCLAALSLLFLICSFSNIYSQTALSLDTLPDRVPAIGCYVPDGMARGYWGNLGLGGTLQTRTRLSGDFINPDGNILFAAGLGNPEKFVGIDLRANVYGLFDEFGAPGNVGEGSLDLHLTRMISPDWWAAAGVHDLTGWQLAPAHQFRSYYLSATGILYFREREDRPFNKLYLTAGAGNGRFRSDGNYSVSKAGPWNLFGSVALKVLPEGNVFVEWTGYNVMTGFSVFPFKKLPAQILVGMDDIFHEKWRFIIAGSIGFSLSKQGGLFRRMTIMPPPAPQTSRVNL